MKTDIVFVAQPINYLRNHAGSVRNSLKDRCVYLKEAFFIIRYIADQLQLSEKSLKNVLERWIGMW
jgi:hypothetical protein